MAKIQLLHERMFSGRPAKSLKVYNDPFGDNEICIEFAFVDGQIEYLAIGPSRPKIVSKTLCFENGLPQEQPDPMSIESRSTNEVADDAQILPHVTELGLHNNAADNA